MSRRSTQPTCSASGSSTLATMSASILAIALTPRAVQNLTEERTQSARVPKLFVLPSQPPYLHTGVRPTYVGARRLTRIWWHGSQQGRKQSRRRRGRRRSSRQQRT
jgi:hypothetical protein